MRTVATLVLFVGASVSLLVSPATAASDDCPSKPFEGTITRAEDARYAQPATKVSGSGVKRALAFDFGSARNTTVYLASYELDPEELGGTIEAPADGVLVTVFLRPKSGDLDAGKRLNTPRDQITVLIDSGGGARATTSGTRAKARVLDFSDEHVCFSIDYRDDLQRVKGRVNAEVG
jgi:hypothetical protein